MAPYRENYVHQILIFFVRNSFESTIKRPSRAGSTLQCDRRGPVAISFAKNALKQPFLGRNRSSPPWWRTRTADPNGMLTLQDRLNRIGINIVTPWTWWTIARVSYGGRPSNQRNMQCELWWSFLIGWNSRSLWPWRQFTILIVYKVIGGESLPPDPRLSEGNDRFSTKYVRKWIYQGD